MKLKILQILIVTSITFLVLSPVLIIFSIIWQQHIEFIAIPDSQSSNTSLVKNITKYQFEITHTLLLSTPIYINLIAFICHRYNQNKMNEYQKNIEMLERIWKQ